MNVKRCVKGHYYDADMHSTCPQCANSLQGFGGENVQNDMPPTDSYSPTEPVAMPSTGNTFNHQYNSEGYEADKHFSGVADAPDFEHKGPGGFGNEVDDYDVKTEPIIINNIAGFTPITGWLVCIEGPERGKDYRIKPGNNYIGRSERMDICLRGDNQISRDRHAMIAYDDVEKVFFFGPVLGQSIVRVNNKLVMSQVELKAYDVISIAATKLIFIPLCGEKFDWDKNDRD